MIAKRIMKTVRFAMCTDPFYLCPKIRVTIVSILFLFRLMDYHQSSSRVFPSPCHCHACLSAPNLQRSVYSSTSNRSSHVPPFPTTPKSVCLPTPAYHRRQPTTVRKTPKMAMPWRTPNNKRTKRVALIRGNLVLDCPVPTRLLAANPRKDDIEFNEMRYSAVTCDPDDFMASHYTLRPRLMQRKTELFIAMTLYNVSP